MLGGPYRPVAELPPGRLLDVGCGSGEIGEAFAKLGWRVSGIEPADDVGRVAAARGIEVHGGTLEDGPWPPQTFDAVVFSDSLEHINGPSAALRRAAELLKPGGLVAITVPNFGSWQRRIFGSCWFALDLPRHLQHFDRSSLESVAARAGLEPVAASTSSMVLGIPSSIQLAIFGRCVVRRGLRVAQVLFLGPYVLVRGIDLVGGGGDRLHLIARRPLREE